MQLLHVQPENPRADGTLIKSELKHNKVDDEMKENDFSDSRDGYRRISSATHTDGNLESEIHLQKQKEPIF